MEIDRERERERERDVAGATMVYLYGCYMNIMLDVKICAEWRGKRESGKGGEHKERERRVYVCAHKRQGGSAPKIKLKAHNSLSTPVGTSIYPVSTT